MESAGCRHWVPETETGLQEYEQVTNDLRA